MKNARIFIDIQNDLIDGTLKNNAAISIMSNIIKYAEALRNVIVKSDEINEILFCTQDTHKKTIEYGNNKAGYIETLEYKKNINEHCILGTYGWLINKHLYNVINGYTTLLQKDTFAYKYWDDYLNDCDTVTLCGLYTDTSVLANALMIRTIYPVKKITVISDLCAGTTPTKHKEALSIMESLMIDIETVYKK